MFGTYLHALTLHAPPQFEIMSMRSSNSEHEERLFGQAKNMVHMATNCQPVTIIPNILLRLQARQKKGDLHKAHKNLSSRISKQFETMKNTSLNSTVSDTFLSSRLSSWQSHLVRISPFLVQGRDVWWHKTTDGYEFCDGNGEHDTRPLGPHLHHFRNTSLNDIYKEKALLFQQIIDQGVELPAPFIKLYNKNGAFIGRRVLGKKT